MKKRRILTLLFLLFSLFTTILALSSVEVDAATSYYSGISDSAYGTSLKSSLRTLISKQSYTSSYDDCKDPNIVKKTDGNANNSKIVLFWSGLETAVAWDGGNTWNREHVWPQSQGWFTTSGAGSDLHHIRPVDSSVNSSHNNHPYGEVSTNDYCHTSKYNGSITIDAKCGGGYFEPSDSKKGDTARIIFYLLVRYSQSDSYPITNVAQSMDMLLEWNRLDPVDESEQRRNEAVYDIQGNRNPFIDNSFYADLIWGGANPDDNPGTNSGSGTGSGGNTGTTPDDNTGTESGATTVPTNGKVATFEFGSNDSSKTNEGSQDGSSKTSYSETSGNYTLTLSSLNKVYTGSYDGVGNSCLKIGTGSAVGGFNFTVPSEIDQVVISVAGYKSNKASVTVNGTTHTISTYSANGNYTNITVDTTSNKTVSLTTTSSGYRCKINTISYYDLDNGGTNIGGGSTSAPDDGGDIKPENTVTNALTTFESFATKTSLIMDYDSYTSVTTVPGSYSYTFTNQVYSSASTKTLNGVKWDPETTLLNSSGTKFYGYDSTKGQQFGSAKNPFKEVIIKTTNNILDGVTKVTIQASTASGSDAQITAYVGGEIIGTTKTLTSTNATYTFTSSAGMRGNIKFRIFQTTSKAIYIKGMSMTYEGTTSYVENYNLNNASIRFGGFISKDLYDILNKSGTKFGVECAAGTISNWSSSNVKTFYCTPAQVSSYGASTTNSNGNVYQWALVLSGLEYEQIDNKFSARVFVEYEGVRYYMSSTTQSLRSVVETYISSSSSEASQHSGILNHLKDY